MHRLAAQIDDVGERATAHQDPAASARAVDRDKGHAHVVCQPTVRVLLEVPADTAGAIVAALGRRGASMAMPAEPDGDLASVETCSPWCEREISRDSLWDNNAAKEWSKRLSRVASL